MSTLTKPRNAWQRASKGLLMGATMCVVAAAMTAGTGYWVRGVVGEQNQAQTAMQAASLALQNTQADRTRLEENLQLFRTLKMSRFAKPPDRLRLIEALESAGRYLGQSTIEWSLAPQETVKPLNDDATGSPVAQLVRVPMRLSARGIHEEEWLDLLTRLQGPDIGYFSTDNCTYDRRTIAAGNTVVPAVDVECNLSWLYVVPEGATVKTP
jgi:hypothetical protein